MLPEDMREYYRDLLFKNDKDDYLWKLVKAADKLSALIKCIEEEKAGNSEFVNARLATEKAISELGLEEVEVFQKEFMNSYKLTLDELQL